MNDQSKETAMKNNQQPGSADLDFGKLQAVADRVDARGLFNASCDIREWIAASRDAIAASRRAAPSLPDVAMPELIYQKHLGGGSWSDEEKADYDAREDSTWRVVHLAAQPAEGSALVAKAERPTAIKMSDQVTLRYEKRTTGDPGWLLYIDDRLVRAMGLAEVDLIEASLTAGAAREGGNTCDKASSDAAVVRAAPDEKERLMKCGACGDGQLYCNSCGTGMAIPILRPAAEGATPAGDAWEPIQTMPVGRFVLCAGEMDGPGDWRMKMGQKDGRTGKITLLGGSWKPTRWTPLPPPPRIDGDKHGEQGGGK